MHIRYLMAMMMSNSTLSLHEWVDDSVKGHLIGLTAWRSLKC